MPNKSTIAMTVAVAASSFVYIKSVTRTKRAIKAQEAGISEWNEYVHMYNEATGTNVTVHRDFINLTAVLDCLK